MKTISLTYYSGQKRKRDTNPSKAMPNCFPEIGKICDYTITANANPTVGTH
jgi:hypothetical protein